MTYHDDWPIKDYNEVEDYFLRRELEEPGKYEEKTLETGRYILVKPEPEKPRGPREVALWTQIPEDMLDGAALAYTHYVRLHPNFRWSHDDPNRGCQCGQPDDGEKSLTIPLTEGGWVMGFNDLKISTDHKPKP